MARSDMTSDWKMLGRFEVLMATIDTDRHRDFGLSLREWQTLKLIADGYTTPEIAEQLYVQPSTVDTFKKRIFEKLEVNSAAQASSLAIAILSGADIRQRSRTDHFG